MGREGALSHPLLAHGGLWGLQAGLACLVTGAEAGRGLGKGGQWALVFAELSPSKMLQPPDKYDLIPPEGSRMEGRHPEAQSWTHPPHFTDWNTKSPGRRRQEATEALTLVPGPNACPLGLPSPGGDPRRGFSRQPRSGQMVGKLLGQTGTQLCTLSHSISFSGPQFLPLTRGLAVSSWQGWGVLGHH